MKATGIVRKIDELGRVVLPIELRRTLGMDIKDPLEIFVDGNQIILKKYTPACILCDSADDVQEIKCRKVCSACRREIASGISDSLR